jgi:hypothetical protein
MSEGKVGEVEVMKHRTYYLVRGQNADLEPAYASAKEMFDRVLRRMLKDTDRLIRPDLATSVCRTFIFECFSRFGRQIAKTVTGQWTHEDLIREADIESAFLAAKNGKDFSETAAESLRARCFNFIRSKDVDAENLKFHLTQGYYLIELLGLDKAKFLPLTNEAFSGAVFYLDTNVLIPRLLAGMQDGSLFDEMLRFARSMGIDLRVTRATLNEARSVGAPQSGQLKYLLSIYEIDTLKELSERTNDHFLNAFFARREQNPSITPDELVAPFDRIREVVEEEIGLRVIDKIEDEILAGRDYSHVAEVMQQKSEQIRKHTKGQLSLKHDVSHYALVIDERNENPKTWFLTGDRTLLEAGATFVRDGTPYCFALVGFLQSISPFLTSPAEEKTVVDVFTQFVTEQIFPPGPIFEVRDLRIFAEYQEDVISTHPDQVVEALDYVKEVVLNGKPYKVSDTDKVSAELKKYLSSSAEEKIQNLTQEAERRAHEAEEARRESQSERERREAAEEEIAGGQVKARRLAAMIANLRTTNTGNEERIESLSSQISHQQRQITNQQHQIDQRKRRDWVILGFVIAIAYWIFDDVIVAYLSHKWEWLVEYDEYVRLILSSASALAFSLPALPYIQNSQWRDEKKVAAFSLIVILAVVLSKVLDNRFLLSVANAVDFGGLLAVLFLSYLFTRKKGDK